MTSELALVSRTGAGQEIIKAEGAQMPTLPSIAILRNQLLETTQSPPAALDQKITWLGTLSRQVSKLQDDCGCVQQETDAKNAKRHPLDPQKILYQRGFDTGAGDVGETRRALRNTLKEVGHAIDKVKHRERASLHPLMADKTVSNIRIIQVLDALGKLTPDSSDHLEDLGAQLMKEKAFRAAAAAFNKFFDKNPQRKDVKVQAIRALVGAQQYERAIEEIQQAKRDLFPDREAHFDTYRQLDMLKADCLIELERFTEARDTLLEYLHEPNFLKDSAVKLLLHSKRYADAQRVLDAKETCKQKKAEVKNKLFFTGFLDGIRKYERGEWGPEELFENVFAMQARFAPYSTRIWGEDRLLSHFDALLFAATYSNKVAQNQELHSAVLSKLATEMLKTGPEAILESIKRRVQSVEKEALSFEQESDQFKKATAQGLGLTTEIEASLVEARKSAYDETTNGSRMLQGKCGLPHSFETLIAILKQMFDSERFEDKKSKATLEPLLKQILRIHNALPAAQTGKSAHIETLDTFTARLAIEQ